MSNKKILVVALFFGLITALALNWYLQQVKNAANSAVTKKVIVANTRIPARSIISSEMISTKEVPHEYSHPDALSEVEDVVGYVTNTDIFAGEQVLRDKLFQKRGKSVGLSFVIPLGTRAMSVPVTKVSGVGGLIKPGDRVDLIGTIELEIMKDPEVSTRTKVSHVLLQNIEVLAVGTNMSTSAAPSIEESEAAEPKASDNNVTLAVPVDKLQALTLMLDHGKISLALRSPLDESEYLRQPFDDSQFLK